MTLLLLYNLNEIDWILFKYYLYFPEISLIFDWHNWSPREKKWSVRDLIVSILALASSLSKVPASSFSLTCFENLFWTFRKSSLLSVNFFFAPPASFSLNSLVTFGIGTKMVRPSCCGFRFIPESLMAVMMFCAACGKAEASMIIFLGSFLEIDVISFKGYLSPSNKTWSSSV